MPAEEDGSVQGHAVILDHVFPTYVAALCLALRSFETGLEAIRHRPQVGFSSSQYPQLAQDPQWHVRARSGPNLRSCSPSSADSEDHNATRKMQHDQPAHGTF